MTLAALTSNLGKIEWVKVLFWLLFCKKIKRPFGHERLPHHRTFIIIHKNDYQFVIKKNKNLSTIECNKMVSEMLKTKHLTRMVQIGSCNSCQEMHASNIFQMT